MKITSDDGFTSIGCAWCNPLFVVMVQRGTEKDAVDLWNGLDNGRRYDNERE